MTCIVRDTLLMANCQFVARTDSTQPDAPPARWHLWASAALPKSQHTADCKCYQSCQVESIFVCDIGSSCSTNSITTKKQHGLLFWPEMWQKPGQLLSHHLVGAFVTRILQPSNTQQLSFHSFLTGHHPLVSGMQVSNLGWSLCSPCLAMVEAPHCSGKQRWHSSSSP